MNFQFIKTDPETRIPGPRIMNSTTLEEAPTHCNIFICMHPVYPLDIYSSEENISRLNAFDFTICDCSDVPLWAMNP